jgi:hypothetical protein
MGLSGVASGLSILVLLCAHRSDHAAASFYSASGEDSQVWLTCALTSMVLAIAGMVLSFWATHRVRERHGLVASWRMAAELVASPSTLLRGRHVFEGRGRTVEVRGSGSGGSLVSVLLMGF